MERERERERKREREEMKTEREPSLLFKGDTLDVFFCPMQRVKHQNNSTH